MPMELKEQPDGKFIEIEMSGKLVKEDYERFVPAMERLLETRGKLRVLVVMRNFQGWTAGALWEDLKFDVKHFRDVTRLAFVGGKKWEEGMARFSIPFTTAEVRYFDESRISDAREWLSGRNGE